MSEKPKATKVDLDSVFVQEIGPFGKYQQRLVLLVAVVSVLNAFTASEYIFSAARINSRCFIPECDSTEGQQFAPDWLSNAIPIFGSSFDSCQRFSANNTTSKFEYCPVTLFNQDEVVPCDQHVYETTDTVVYDFDLACDEWRRSMIGSARTIGVLGGVILSGLISDSWGRRTALIFTAFNACWMGILRLTVATYIQFVLSVFFEAFFGYGTMACAYILRQCIMAIVAWSTPNWRVYTICLYVPQVLVISYLWLVPESVRWYLSKGRYEEAESTLKRVAEINGKQLTDKSIQALKEADEEENAKTHAELKDSKWLIIQVFKHKQILIRCLITPIWWITFTFNYYGLSINSVNMTGNKYLNYIAVSAVEIPGYWVAPILLDRLGRKPGLIFAYWTCAACQIAYIFIPNELYGLSLTVYLISKFAISIAAVGLYLYTSELYPTKHRHTFFGYSSMIGRIGSVVAPLTPAIAEAVWSQLPFAMFAALGVLSGALVLSTPETRAVALPDTMQDAADIGRHKTDNHEQ